MAIKARDQVKWKIGGTELTLEADTGEAFLVKDIMVTSAAGSYLSVSIDKTTVGYFRNDSSNLGNHIYLPSISAHRFTVLRYLASKGIFKGYPVAEGQKITVSTDTGNHFAVIYDIYEPGDISPDMENGSEAKEYFLINYGRKALSGTLSDGDNELVYSMLPSEFPSFPFGADVPAKTTIEIYGVLASDVGRTSNSGANKQKTNYLKFIKERQVLFDEDKRGLLLLGSIPSSDTVSVGSGWSIVGNYSTKDERLPLMFSEPLSFSAGEELTIVLSTEVTVGSANIDVKYGEVALIEKIKRVA